MLKVTMYCEQSVNRMVIEGRLATPETSELARVWLQARELDSARPIEVDLTGLTYVDRQGAELLAAMHRRGVRLPGTGAMTRALIDAAAGRAAGNGGTP
jgi:anti-anti-sigma regulatory factor